LGPFWRVGPYASGLMLSRSPPPPGFIAPCPPTPSRTVPAGLGGYRFVVQRDGDRVRVFSRHGKDWTDKVPLIVEAAAQTSPGRPTFRAPRRRRVDDLRLLVRPRGGGHRSEAEGSALSLRAVRRSRIRTRRPRRAMGVAGRGSSGVIWLMRLLARITIAAKVAVVSMRRRSGYRQTFACVTPGAPA
jgi:hypothetical protein